MQMSKANEEKDAKEGAQLSADASKIAVTGNMADMLANSMLLMAHAQRGLLTVSENPRYANDADFASRYLALATEGVTQAFDSVATMVDAVKGEKGKFGKVDPEMFASALRTVAEITGSTPDAGGSKLGGLLTAGAKKAAQG
jgi:uncharacterized membrane protein